MEAPHNVIQSLSRVAEGRLQKGVRASARWAKQEPLGAIGAAWIVVTIGVALLAPVLSPHDPLELLGTKYRPPDGEFLLGTDQLGRDVLSRLVYGTRPSVFVGVFAISFAVVVGGLWGIAAGYIGGAFDLLTQRLVDIMGAFPALLTALALMAVLGASSRNVVIALIFTFAPSVARVVRSAALSVKTETYVEATRAIGCSETRILMRHIVPNCMALLIILFSIYVGSGIIIAASLSFLGAGIPESVPSWGGMLSKAVGAFLVTSPWLAIVPGAAISMTVLAFNLLGDSLRDTLDPKLRGMRQISTPGR